MTIDMLKTTALGTCLSLALALPAAAQDSTASGSSAQAQTDSSASQSSQSADAAQSDKSNSQSQSGQSLAPETIVARVGETEILGADVIDFVAALPPRMREQPPQMLMSMAIDQVILRELLLQEAQSQNLAEDSRVTEIVKRDTEVAQEDAMVAVYLQDQLSERVTDSAVQQAYEQLQSQVSEDQDLPPLENLRPQIKQQLQQQALNFLRQDLVEGEEIVVYSVGETASGSENDGSGSQSGASESQNKQEPESTDSQ